MLQRSVEWKYCEQCQVKENNYHERDSPPICIGLCETTAIEKNIFCETRNFRYCKCPSARLKSVGDDNSLTRKARHLANPPLGTQWCNCTICIYMRLSWSSK